MLRGRTCVNHCHDSMRDFVMGKWQTSHDEEPQSTEETKPSFIFIPIIMYFVVIVMVTEVKESEEQQEAGEHQEKIGPNKNRATQEFGFLHIVFCRHILNMDNHWWRKRIRREFWMNRFRWHIDEANGWRLGFHNGNLLHRSFCFDVHFHRFSRLHFTSNDWRFLVQTFETFLLLTIQNKTSLFFPTSNEKDE